MKITAEKMRTPSAKIYDTEKQHTHPNRNVNGSGPILDHNASSVDVVRRDDQLKIYGPIANFCCK